MTSSVGRCRTGSPEARPIRTEDLLKGKIRRAIAWENAERSKQERFASTLVVAAMIIVALRLAREPEGPPRDEGDSHRSPAVPGS
jgi:hypothetical protein